MNIPEVLRKVQSEGIKFIIIRSIDSVVATLAKGTGDIDIFVESKDYDSLVGALGKYGFYKFNHQGNAFIKASEPIFLDIHKEPYTRFPELSFSLLYNRAVKFEGLSYPSCIDLCEIYLFHPMDLYGIHGSRSLSGEKYEFLKNNIKTYINTNEDTSFVRTNRLKKSLYKLFDSRSETEFISRYKLLTKQLKYRQLIRRKGVLIFLKRHVLTRYLDFFRITLKGPKIIAFSGVDGSGKTTLIDDVSTELHRHKNRVKYVYFGALGGYILPFENLRRLSNLYFRKKNKKKPKKEYTESHKLPRKLEYFLFFEYITRVALIYLYRSKHDIIILDRYWVDLLRTDISFKRLFKVGTKLLKCRLFVIIGDTDLFYHRKKEYSAAILRKHQNALLESSLKFFEDKTYVINEQARELRVQKVLRVLNEDRKSFRV